MKKLYSGLICLTLAIIIFASVSRVSAQSGTWTNGAPIPTASYGLGGAFVGGKFYAISGFATARLGIYNPANNSWTTGSSLPADTGYNLRQYFGITVLNTNIYVIGGDTGGSGDRATMLCYNTMANSWTTLAPMALGPRYGLGAATINGLIYAIGGYSLESSTYLTRVEVYNPTNNTWTTAASLPMALSSPLIGAINGKIYVAGGGNASGALTNTYVYDPSLNAWSTNAPMPVAGNGTPGVLNGMLFSIGGVNASQNFVFAYDPILNTWNTNFTLMPVSTSNVGAAADQANNKIYAVAGYYSGYVSALQVFTLPVPPLNIASSGNQSVLFWPASATNYLLQTTTNLSSPNWVTVSNGTPIIGVTLTNSLPASYFRLQQQ
jgi:N-acetylneuraminic acid mutarotase